MLANPFQPWVNRGFTQDLLPIIPPGAALSPYSALTPAHRGKTPGLPTIDGATGFPDWPQYHATSDDTVRWATEANGVLYNVGLNARTLHAFDVDTEDPAFARMVFDIMRAKIPDVLDATGIRIGRAPGFLVPFRPETQHRKGRIVFMRDGRKSAVEMLGVGQQYVIAGNHPSGKPYQWRRIGKTVLVDLDLSGIAIVLNERLIDVWQTIQGELPRASYTLYKPSRPRQSGGATEGDATPESLLAPALDDVAAALASLPNRPENKRDREEWIQFLHAIAGATGKSAEGRKLWLDWSAEWDSSDAAEHDAATRWDTLGPVGIGWAWLESKAHESADFGVTSARNAFAGEELNGVAALDGGLFEKPQKDHPTTEDLDAAISAMQPSDMNAVDAFIKMLAQSRLSNARRESYLQQLKKLTKIGLGVLREQLSNDIANLMRDGEDIGMRLASVALKIFGDGMLAYYRHRFWGYTGKMWERVEDTVITSAMERSIQSDNRLLMTPRGQTAHAASMIKAGLDILKMRTCKVLEPLERKEFIIRDVINLRNGTLHLARDGRHEFKPHDPRDCFTYMLDIDYDPLATGTLYDRIIRDMQSRSHYTLTADDGDWSRVKSLVDRANASERNPIDVGDDCLAWRVGKSYRVADLRENCRLINEVLGYALVPRRFTRQFVILKGNGVNGKTALVQSVASRMPAMVFATSIENLRSRFTLNELRGKLLVTVDEGTQVEAPDDTLKMISENIKLSTDVKGRDFVEFWTTSFVIINTNRHFYTTDNSDGMRSRLIFVPCFKQYSMDERRNNPWQDLMSNEQELSAAFNRWLDGLTDVLARCIIEPTRASLELFAKWQRNNTAEAAFISECCTLKAPVDVKADGTGLDELHPAYQGWFAREHGSVKNARGRNRFADVLEQLGHERYESNGRVRFRGLWLKPNLGLIGSAGHDFAPLIEDNPGDD